MTVQLVVGSVALAVALAVAGAGALRLRRSLLPEFSGAPARLIEICTVLAVVLGSAQVLGMVGLLKPVPLLLGLVAVGVVLIRLAPRLAGSVSGTAEDEPGEEREEEREEEPDAAPTETAEEAPEPPPLTQTGRLLTVGVLALVAAVWTPMTIMALRFGVSSADSVWYHLPAATRFAQTGSIFTIQHFDATELTAFYPFTAQLLHSIPMVAAGTDMYVPIMNVGWAVLALLGAWCIGRSVGVAPMTLAGAAILLTLPGFVALQAGGAHNDIVGLALLLAALGILIGPNPRSLASSPYQLAIAGAFVGLALATKWIFIPGAALLTIGVPFLLPRAHRGRGAAIWLVSVVAFGGPSYLRNLVGVGNPLPPLDATIGGFGFERITPPQVGESSVLEFILGDSFKVSYLVDGLDLVIGWAWPLVALLSIVGAIVAVVLGPGRPVRMLGLLALIAGFAYLAAPQLLFLFGQPYYFASNLRYGFLALILGLVLLPLACATRSAWARRATGVGLGAALVATVAAAWPTGLEHPGFPDPVESWAAAVGATVGMVVLLVGLATVLLPQLRSPRVIAAMGVVALLALAGFSVLTDDRYANQAESWRWSDELSDEDIGLEGTFVQYPYVGSDLSNRVEFIAEEGPAGRRPIDLCADWKRAVNERGYAYVVTGGMVHVELDGDEIEWVLQGPPPQRDWLDADPAAESVGTAGAEAMHRITGQLDPAVCPEPTSA